jgi:DnaJ-class molecular chaperone
MPADHMVDCGDCNGVGLLADRHPHDPAAMDVKCDWCGGYGQVPCTNPFCECQSTNEEVQSGK